MNVRILNTTQTLDRIETRMLNSDKVFFVRFGDNDLFHIVGRDQFGRAMNENRKIGNNKTHFSDKLQEDIKKSFYIDHGDYLRGLTGEWPLEDGMKPNVFGSKRPKVVFDYLEEVADKSEYLNPITFHYLFMFKPVMLRDFFDEFIKPKSVLFVGSANENNINIVFGGLIDYIYTPSKNAYTEKSSILPKIKTSIRKNSPDVVILACGQLGRAIFHDLWRMNERFHCIDIGSMVDAIDRKRTRRWIKKTNAHENIRYFL